jgi:hypothetical protein
MSKVSISKGTKSRRPAATLLALWLGAVSCFVCCPTQASPLVAGTSDGREHHASAHRLAGDRSAVSSPGSEHAGCAQANEKPSQATVEKRRAATATESRTAKRETRLAGFSTRSTPGWECCKPERQLADAPRRPRVFKESTAVSTAGAAARMQHPSTYASSALPPSPSGLMNRGGTYLLCCVFLI